jgi:uncharacterized protein involved in exopolysaccharide biosynthesis/Mrp family chromosome partitioning ATPase
LKGSAGLPAHEYIDATNENDLKGKSINISDVSVFVRRYLLVIVTLFIAGGAAASFYAISSDPVYTARTQVLIEPNLSQALQQNSGVVTSLDTAQVESQIAVMRSEKIAAMVIAELDLGNDPDFLRSQGLSIVNRMARAVTAILRMLGLEEAPRPDFLAWTYSVEPVATPDDVGGLSEFERERFTIDLFHSSMEIRRVGVSYAVDIYFRSRDPALAADLANTTASMFIREQMETKAAATRAGGEWLEHRMGEMRTRMNHATRLAQEFRARHDYRVRPLDATDAPMDDTATLEELEVNADTYRQMYESFLVAYTNNVSNQSYPVADARIITPATEPLSASHPRKKLILAFGLMSGLMSGIGVAFFHNLLDRTLRSPRQISEELGLRCIGELPHQPGRNGGFGALDAVVATPHSWFSECLRRARAELANGSTPPRCIGVTSALPREGKATVACNLALLYAGAGHRTALVDADAEEALLSREMLAGSGHGEGASHLQDDPHPGKIVHQAFGTVDLLSNDLKKPLQGSHLPDLSAYDRVVVNLPPLAAGADQLRIAGALDGNLIVGEAGRTPLELVRELVMTLRSHNATILGLLLTKARRQSIRPYTDEMPGSRTKSSRRLTTPSFRRVHL